MNLEQKFKIEHISCLNESMLSELRGEGVVIFAGSYVSTYLPSCLPNGAAFCRAMYQYIFNELYDDKKIICKLFSEIPFEALFEVTSNHEKSLDAIYAIYSNAVANDVHKLLADQLSNNLISAVITPNYDCAIDHEFSNSSSHAKIVTQEDYTQWRRNSRKPVYFKIHGSAEKDSKASIVYTLNQEGALPDWKKELLGEVIRDKIVLFIGYSGRDFDICPLIAETKLYSKIYWLHYIGPDDENPTQKLSGYARLLLNSKNENVMIHGDLIELLNKIYARSIPKSGSKNYNLNAKSIFGMNEAEILYWRLSIIARVGCSELGLQTLELYKFILNESTYKLFKSQYYAHQGKYRMAARIAEETVRGLSMQSPDYFKCWFHYTDVLISYGSYLRSLIGINKIRKFYLQENPRNKESEAKLLRLQLTFNSRMYDWTKLLFFLRPFRPLVERSARKVINEAMLNLVEFGYWDDRQILQLHAERFGIILNLSLPSEVGFRNLGLPTLDIIKYKDRIRKGTDEERKEALNKIDDYIQLTMEMDYYPEIWKLNSLKVKYLENLTLQEKKTCLKLWKNNLRQTEYPFLIKTLFLLQYYVAKMKVILKVRSTEK